MSLSITAHARLPRSVRFATQYEEQTPAEENLVIPEDLTELSNEDLTSLSERARAAFAALFGTDGSDLSSEDFATLEGLTEGIEALDAEQATRDAAAAERAEQAAALAARIGAVPEASTDDPADDGDEEDTDSDDGEEEDEDEEREEEEAQPETPAETPAAAPAEGSLAAGATPAPRREVRVNLSGLRSRQTAHRPAPTTQALTMRDVVRAAPDLPNYQNGMDFHDLGAAINSRLMSFNSAPFDQAARANRHIRQQFGLAAIRKPFEDGLIVRSADPEHIEDVFAHAVSESRLPGGSLVASGGWCAPSETLYDLFEMGESRDGLFSLPEINVNRGGIRWTPGPDFQSLYADITGFHYTEEQDIDGTYAVDANGDGTGAAGDKPCYKVPCPDFLEARLDLDGLCISAGLLQRRGYPEMIARVVRGALVAHDHRLAARKIGDVVSGSTAIAMPAGQVGAAAPILTAIELQVQHYRTGVRMARGTTLEAVFPDWVRGVIRSDLSRRLGVELISVPDSRIDQWFRDRGVNPQFIYNWQDIGTTAAGDFTAWPTEVTFLLYAAGTWVSGGSDVITLDTIYDSILLGQNDYIALFTEEGYLVAKRGHDSRAVTVPICADGSTGAGVEIACDGSAAVAA